MHRISRVEGAPRPLARVLATPTVHWRTLSSRTVAYSVVLGLLVVLAGMSLRGQLLLLEAPWIYRKDFVQDWLMARAVLDGQNPYATEQALAARYLPGLLPQAVPHASPHPPLVALLVTPFGLVSYAQALDIWLGLEIALVVVGVALLMRLALPGHARWRWFIPALIAVLAWQPTTAEFAYGQFGSLVLALVSGAWLAFQCRRSRLAGVLLGLAIAVKLLPLILVAYFVAIGCWRVIRWTAATVIVTTAGSWLLLGTEAWRSFMTDGLFGESGFWHATEGNYSVYGAVAHLVEGLPYLPPLIPAPQLLLPLTGVLVVGLCGLAWRAWRTAPADIGLAVACTLMLLVSPVTWPHYLILLIGPIIVATRRLSELGWPSGMRKLALAALFCLSVPVSTISPTLVSLFVVRGPNGSVVDIPPEANLPLFVFLAGPLLLFITLLRLNTALHLPGARAAWFA